MPRIYEEEERNYIGFFILIGILLAGVIAISLVMAFTPGPLPYSPPIPLNETNNTNQTSNVVNRTGNITPQIPNENRTTQPESNRTPEEPEEREPQRNETRRPSETPQRPVITLPPLEEIRDQSASRTANATTLGISNETYLERRIHDEINERRTAMSLSALQFDSELAEIAGEHSEDMARRDYFSHVSPNGNDLADRYSDADYSCRIVRGNIVYQGAENLFQAWTFDSVTYVNNDVISRDYLTNDEIAEIVAEGWMQSSGHRQNILRPYWENEGIGVIITRDGKVFVTQNFC